MAHVLTITVLFFSLLVTPTAMGATLPVVVVHGHERAPADFATFTAYLEERGYTVFAPQLPGQWASQNATYLKTYIDGVLTETGATKVHLVGHSLGGSAARACIKQVVGCGDKVQTYLGIDSAQYGYWANCFLPASNAGELCNWWPWNGWIAALNAGDDTPGPAFWAQVINPASPWPLTSLDGAPVCVITVPSSNHITMLADPALMPKYEAVLRGECP